MQLSSVEEASGRQVPRHREAGRRKHETTMTRRTPRKGRLRPGKLQLIQSAAVSFAVNSGFLRNQHHHNGKYFHTSFLVDLRLLEFSNTIASVRIDIRRTSRAVHMCACGRQLQHVCMDGGKMPSGFAAFSKNGLLVAGRITHITSKTVFRPSSCS